MKNTFIIGIAGGTASGKSTFTRRLKERFKKSVVVLHHDDYYRDQTEIAPEERKKINYDHPDSLDTELLLSHLAMLLYNMLPYIISLLVLAIASTNSRAPKAEGIPYDKGQR